MEKISTVSSSSFRNFKWDEKEYFCIDDLRTLRSVYKMIAYVEDIMGWNIKLFDYLGENNWTSVKHAVSLGFQYCPRLFVSEQDIPDYINDMYCGTMQKYYAKLMNELDIFRPCLVNIVVGYL